MRFIPGDSTDVYYNLALEEYVLNELKGDSYFLLWVNDPCVVAGRHQNMFAEINSRELEQRGIPAARRNSGGGAVYHDRGNLNYSFITDHDPESFAGYDPFLNPLVKALNSLGVPAAKGNICDIAVAGQKISGSAQSIRNRRLLHHGTLLFDADLDALRALLKPAGGVFASKAVASVRSCVANLKDYLGCSVPDMEGFKKALLEALFPQGLDRRALSGGEIAAIRELAAGKYAAWEWIYGASPKFTFEKNALFLGRPCTIQLTVEQGVVRECRLDSATLPGDRVRVALVGQRYGWRNVSKQLQQLPHGPELADYLFQ